jgi:hypothetical protein
VSGTRVTGKGTKPRATSMAANESREEPGLSTVKVVGAFGSFRCILHWGPKQKISTLRDHPAILFHYLPFEYPQQQWEIRNSFSWWRINSDSSVYEQGAGLGVVGEYTSIITSPGSARGRREEHKARL